MTPDEFDVARKRIWDELVHLHDAWDQYRELYGHSAERIKLLNACAGWFFGVHQRLLMRETVLGISRLTDPLTSGTRSNLVLSTLLLDPELQNRRDLAAEIQRRIAEVTEAAASVRAHRNKYIAHLDHAVAMATADEPLPGLSRAAITAVIETMEDVYNLHGGAILDSHAMFELAPLGSVKALIRILEDSDRWKKWQEIQRRSGEADDTPGAA